MKEINKRWIISFSNDKNEKSILYQKVYFNNLVDDYDWVYEDYDRTYMLFLDVDKENPSKAITDFVDYVSTKFNFSRKEEDIFDYLIRGFDWNDIEYCIDILNNDINDDVLEFLIKFNFRIELKKN